MGSFEKKSFSKKDDENRSQLPDFMSMDTIKQLYQQSEQDRRSQAEYVSKHGVPTAHDILRSVDLSRPDISAVAAFKETAYDILRSIDLSQTNVSVATFKETVHDILRRGDPSQQSPYLSRLYQRSPLTEALRPRINEAQTTEVNASQSDLGPDKASDGILAEQFNFLLRSTHVQRLARIVNAEKKVILSLEKPQDAYDVSYTYNAAYYAENHLIHIPLKRPDGTAKSVEEIREDILWEMSNASLRKQFMRLDEKFFTEKPDQNAPHKEKENYFYKMAALALASEWLEWANIIEHALRCQAINADPNMGAGGPHITEKYQRVIQPDHSWRHFDAFLKWMIEKKHITVYDPHAAEPSWVGEHFLAVVKKRSPDKLQIKQRQVEGWLAGKMEKIKSPSSVPFGSSAIIEKAVQQARVRQVGTGQTLGPREQSLPDNLLNKR